jgi:hypothetical protein
MSGFFKPKEGLAQAQISFDLCGLPSRVQLAAATESECDESGA